MTQLGRAVAGVIVLMMLVSPVAHAVDVQRDIIAVAYRYEGSQYCTGGISPPCFDCSGFVQRVYSGVVPDLPRISRDQAQFGTQVPRHDLRPGDLVFFATGPRAEVVTHVAIYMGQDSIIHAISNGPNRGVNVTSLSGGYWERRFFTAARVLPEITSATVADADEAIEFARGRYTGELQDGEPHGFGTMQMSNGDRYEGGFRSGLFEGEGIYVWTTGERYEGAFRAGEMHGEGTFVSADGTVTSGRWNNGARVVEADATPAEQEIQERTTRRTYISSHESPWDTWEGVVEGDFLLWQQQQEEAFDDFMQRRQTPPESQW